MSTATARLLSEFEALRADEKQEFVRELIHRFAWDSGSLDDGTAAAAGDEIAAMLEEEERGPQTR